MKLRCFAASLGLLLTCPLVAESERGLLPDTATLIEARAVVYLSRDRASHTLGRSLPEADVRALLDFLVRKLGDDAASEDELASLKNNAADALLAQVDLPPKLLDVFKEAFVAEAQGDTWREYVVQKIPELVKRAAPAERELGLAFLRERFADKRYIYAGTALLGAQRLNDAPEVWMSAAEVADAARIILNDEAYAAASKTTALQILARHEPGEALVLARRWLDEQMPIMHRVSALATLGAVGETTDRELLSRYASSPEFRLRTAARAALAKLEARLGMQAS